jgi:hypothetical protein
MPSTIRTRTSAIVLGALALVVAAAGSAALAQGGRCTSAERREALQRMEQDVRRIAPRQLASLTEAIAPGGPLAAWMLSHGHVVLADAGGVVLGKVDARPPAPQLLIYAPSPSSRPADWLDFDGPDGPYQLVGWGYFAPYQPGSQPPELPCITAREWHVHEAGWHLMDGGMRLTPGATAEPPRPSDGTPIFFWHPQMWDIHLWMRDGGPVIAYANPGARPGGMWLPAGAAFTVKHGRQRPIAPAR